VPILLSIAERSLGIVVGVARTGVSAASGIVAAVRGSSRDGAAGPAPKSQLTDTALARKVESELFRDTAVPKGKIDVNAVGRVVYLRGEARSAAMIADLSVRAQAIPEVERVENLVETPRTRRSEGTPAKRAAPTRRRTSARKVNAEAAPTAPEVEPSPKDLAAKGEGRRAAPLGSSDPETGEAQTPRAPRPKGGASKGGPSTRRARPVRRVNAEIPPTAPEAEPSPKEMAARGEGRRAAPLGSADPENDGGADTEAASPEPGEDVGA